MASKCRSCGADIVWLTTIGASKIPVDAQTVKAGTEVFDGKLGHVSHFATCPDSKKWRKDKQGVNYYGKEKE